MAYEGLTVDKQGGGAPRFVVQDEKGETTRTLDISKLQRGEIRGVLKQLGFSPSRVLEEVGRPAGAASPTEL